MCKNLLRQCLTSRKRYEYLWIDSNVVESGSIYKGEQIIVLPVQYGTMYLDEFALLCIHAKI